MPHWFFVILGIVTITNRNSNVLVILIKTILWFAFLSIVGFGVLLFMVR